MLTWETELGKRMFSVVRNLLQQILNCKKIWSGCTHSRTTVLALVIIRGLLSSRFLMIYNAEAAAPPAPTLQRFSLGQVLYVRQCADCHGWEGQGEGPLTAVLAAKPRNLRASTALFRQNSDVQIVARVLYGTPLMAIRPEALPYREDELAALAAYIRTLPTTNWAEIEQGKGVYDSLCAACHGLYGRGDGLGARSLRAQLPDLADPVYQRQARDDILINNITNGIGIMPGAGDVLTAHEIRSVVTFLHILSPGYELYSRFCAHCHGGDGVPPTATTQKATPQKVPPRLDDAYFSTHTPDQIRTGIQHMGRQSRPTMPHMARELNADEAFAIVGYLRRLSSPTSQEETPQ